MINVKIKLPNGVYAIRDGRDCDGYPYQALLVIAGEDAYVSEWNTASYFEDTLKKVIVPEGKDLFEHLNVWHYEKYKD